MLPFSLHFQRKLVPYEITRRCLYGSLYTSFSGESLRQQFPWNRIEIRCAGKPSVVYVLNPSKRFSYRFCHDVEYFLYNAQNGTEKVEYFLNAFVSIFVRRVAAVALR